MFVSEFSELPPERLAAARELIFAAGYGETFFHLRAATLDEIERVLGRSLGAGTWRKFHSAAWWEANCQIYGISEPWPQCRITLGTLRDCAAYLGELPATYLEAAAHARDLVPLFTHVTPLPVREVLALPQPLTLNAARHAARVIAAPAVAIATDGKRQREVATVCRELRSALGVSERTGSCVQLLLAQAWLRPGSPVTPDTVAAWLQRTAKRTTPPTPLTPDALARTLVQAPGRAMTELNVAAAHGITLRVLRTWLRLHNFDVKYGIVRLPADADVPIAPQMFARPRKIVPRKALRIDAWCALLGVNLDFDASTRSGYLRKAKKWDCFVATDLLRAEVWQLRDPKFPTCANAATDPDWRARIEACLIPYVKEARVRAIILQHAHAIEYAQPDAVAAWVRRTIGIDYRTPKEIK